jgi:hypothetical protein
MNYITFLPNKSDKNVLADLIIDKHFDHDYITGLYNWTVGICQWHTLCKNAKIFEGAGGGGRNYQFGNNIRHLLWHVNVMLVCKICSWPIAFMLNNPRADGLKRRARVLIPPRLFTPGETKALAESKVHQLSRAWVSELNLFTWNDNIQSFGS